MPLQLFDSFSSIFRKKISIIYLKSHTLKICHRLSLQLQYKNLKTRDNNFDFVFIKKFQKQKMLWDNNLPMTEKKKREDYLKMKIG